MLADRIIEQQQAASNARAEARPIGNARAQQLAQLLQNENVRRTLQMVRSAEGTQKFAEPERVNFGNSRNPDLSKHPGIARYFNNKAGGPNATTATGAYQFIGSTWANAAKALDLPDFSRQSQDLAALHLIQQRGGLAAAQQGDVPTLARKLGNEWASLGHNAYQQPTRGIGWLQAAFNAPLADGGTQVNYAADPGGKQVAARSGGIAIQQTANGFRQGGGASDPLQQPDGIQSAESVIAGTDLSQMQQFLLEQMKALQAMQTPIKPTETLPIAPLPTFGGNYV